MTVTRGTADADLEALSLSKGRLVPLFSPNTHAYTSRVGDQLSATRTTVTARARSASSTVRITPPDIDTSAAAAGHQVALSAGANVIEVQVTAAGGSPSKTYRIDVTRAAMPANHAPTAHAGMDQIVGEDETVTLAGGGTDPEGATLSYRWWQTGGVPVRLSSPTARNPTFTAPNLPSQGTLTFALVVNDGAQDSEIADEVVITIRADNVVSFATTSASAPEGGVATLVVTTSRARPTALALRYTLGADGDPATADADAEDYGERVGEATLAAGETRTTIALAIADDDVIEPPRETFAVTFDVAGGNDPIGTKMALVTIEEGVCDRTPQVREALRARTARRGGTGVEWNCRSVTGGALSALSSLDLSGRGIEALRGADLEGLHGLRTLNLGGNRLTALPTGLFEGMAALDELNLSDNPGAPFALVMELARVDAADAAPGPATLKARVAAGAPFPMQARLIAAGAVVSDAKGAVESVDVALGKSASGPFAAELAAGASLARVALEVDAVPSDECGDYSSHRCFRGVETAAGSALVLFKERPRMVGTEPAGVTLAGVDEYRVPLTPLFTAAAGETLAFEAESDDPTLARAWVANGVLEIAPSLDGREGVATITVVAVDSDGLRVTLRFQVTVQFLPVHGRFQGWRLALPAIRIDSGNGN